MDGPFSTPQGDTTLGLGTGADGALAEDSSSRPSSATGSCPGRRAPYSAPCLEALGRWSALTLYTSFGIGPGG
jgi:hypothetical protein